MKKAFLIRVIPIKLVLMAFLMLAQPASGEDLPEHAEVLFKGRIFGDQLILIDKTGRKLTAEDGIYTTQDGEKIEVMEGTIVAVPTSKSKGIYSAFRIVEVDFLKRQ
jgi:hypothetical protein